MSLSRSLNRVVAKATYDPELEKQLAEEKKKAREARTKFREQLDSLQAKDKQFTLEGKLSPIGSTQSTALFKTMNDWLSANPEATSDEIIDKSLETVDKLSAIYNEDKNRIYFLNSLKVTEAVLLQLKTKNAISEDDYKKAKAIVDRENTWFEKNPNESLLTYKDHIEKAATEINTVIKDPDAVNSLKTGQANVSLDDTTKELDEKKKEAEALAAQKEQKEKEEFNIGRLLKKIGGGFGIAILVAVVLSLAFVGGSLASNEAVVRPLPFRLLYFAYGFLFWPVVITYFIVLYFMGKRPYFASLLIPLFEYDPATTQKDSFLQKLVWFKANPVVEHATKTFQEAADAVKDTKIDFTAVAAQIAKGE